MMSLEMKYQASVLAIDGVKSFMEEALVDEPLSDEEYEVYMAMKELLWQLKGLRIEEV